MQRLHFPVIALLAAVLSPFALAAPPGVETQVLLRSDKSWDGTDYTAYPTTAPELTVLKISIAPDTELDWHSHPIPNAAYVLSGEITVEAKNSNAKQTLRQGDTLAEMVNLPHRGKTGGQPAELIVFYAGSKGMPLSQKE